MTQTLINLFAGPGKGKSTTAAGLFHLMKLRGHSIEYVPEYAKDLAWEGRVRNATQIELVMKQYLRLERLKRHPKAPTATRNSKPDYIVTDCPILLGLVYGKMAPGYLPPSWPQLLKELHFSFNSVNIFLTGNKSYNENGRAHSEEDAKILHECIRQMLNREGIHAYYLNYAGDTPEQIYQLLSDIKDETAGMWPTMEETEHAIAHVIGNDGFREEQK
jgi:hypothetical protein